MNGVTANQPDAVALLESELKGFFPAATFDSQRFPSGAFMLDMRLDHRFFVIAYGPTNGYGFDEIHPGEGMDSSFTNSAATIDELKVRLLELVRGTQTR